MQVRNILLAATLVALPATLHAQPLYGWYVGAGVGINQLMDMTPSNQPLGGNAKLKSDIGLASKINVGYGFGNGLRLELEGDYRYQNTHQDRVLLGTGGGHSEQYGPMVNLLYDFDVGSPVVFPYVGVGVGAQWLRISGNNASSGSDPQAAAQGIVGASFPITREWAITADVRAMGFLGQVKYNTPSGFNSGKLDNPINVSGLIGLRYAFLPPPPPPPAPMPAPAAAEARTYLVFFDWDKSDLTARARQIIADAAAASTRLAVTRIDVSGHADRTGTAQYNQALSMRRAQTVAAELVKLGVKKEAISIAAYGDTRPLVPTGPGVREPQNRRVEIVLK